MSSPDMVTCALHGRSRLAKFCIEKPVYDAFGKIVRTSYECLDTASCLKGNLKKTAEREQQATSSFETLGDDDVTNEDNNNNLIKDSSNNTSNVQLSNVDMLLASKALPTKKNTFADMTTSDDTDNNNNKTSNTTTDDTSKPSDVAKIISAGANRYYDLSRIGDTKKDDPINKLCFICGQSGHERPKCPNVVCRKCRLPGCKGYPETCRPHQGLETPCSLLGVPSQKKGGFALSQIARKSSSSPNNKDSSSSSGALVAPLFIGTRCTLCRQEGHLDCAHLSNPPNWKEQCIVCGRVGHYGLACPSRRFDRWVDDMRRFASSGSKFNNNSGQQSYGSGSAGNFGSHGRSNDDSSSMKCFNCGQAGHISRECPEGRRQYNNNNYNQNNQQDRFGGGGGAAPPPSTMECYNCGRTGHLSRDCPDRRGQYESGNRRGRDHYNDNNNYNNNNSRYGERTQNEDRDMRRGGNYNNNNNYNNNRPPRSYSGGGGGGGRRR